jgi:hypothetical protein
LASGTGATAYGVSVSPKSGRKKSTLRREPVK